MEKSDEAILKEDRARAQREALAVIDSSDKGIFQIIKDFVAMIFDMIFGDTPDDGEEPVAPKQTYRERSATAANFVSSAALPAWQKYMRENKDEVVIHRNPVAGHAVVTSGKGLRNTKIAGASHDHQGVDLDVTKGETAFIRPSAKGIVVFADVMNGYGNTVVIGHADGTKTLYAHMTGGHRPILGERVTPQDIIGEMGNTSNGRIQNMRVHLHYEQIDTEKNRVTPVVAGVELRKDMQLADSGAVMAGVSRSTRPEVPVAVDIPTNVAKFPATLRPVHVAATNALKPMTTKIGAIIPYSPQIEPENGLLAMARDASQRALAFVGLA